VGTCAAQHVALYISKLQAVNIKCYLQLLVYTPAAGPSRYGRCVRRTWTPALSPCIYWTVAHAKHSFTYNMYEGL
jgi:hypothetical protein